MWCPEEGGTNKTGRSSAVTNREGFSCENIPIIKEEKSRNDSVVSTDSGLGDCGREYDPETGLEVISLMEVSYHDTREDGWLVIYDKVYHVTEYLRMHPGGEEVMLEYLGYDATLAFRGVAHSRSAMMLLKNYCVGILPRQERLGLVEDL